MKAMVIEEYCSEPKFVEKEIPLNALMGGSEEPSGKQLLIKLKTSSVNPVDYKIRKGAMSMMTKLKFPATLGKDGAGIVEKVGPKVTAFKVGDEVVGFLPNNKMGSYAQYAVYEEDEIVHKPKEMTFQQAVAFPLVGCTIMEMYRRHPLIGEVLDREGKNAKDTGKISDALEESKKPPLKILVVGASGGTGSVAVLFAKQFLQRYFNTKVYAVCSERNREFVTSMGADVVIDYTKTSAKAGSETTHDKGGMSDLPSICQTIKNEHGDAYVDIVLDCVGGYYYYDDVCKNLDCSQAKPSVVFTTISTPNPNEQTMSMSTIFQVGSFLIGNKIKSISSSYPCFHMVFLGKNHNDLNLLINHVVTNNEAYKKFPLVPFSLENIKEAHLQMESQRTVGKIVIDIQ